jgi:hypothetical protein
LRLILPAQRDDLTIETSNAQGSPQTYNMAAADVSRADSRSSGRRRRQGRQSVAFAAEIPCSSQSLAANTNLQGISRSLRGFSVLRNPPDLATLAWKKGSFPAPPPQNGRIISDPAGERSRFSQSALAEPGGPSDESSQKHDVEHGQLHLG